MSDWLEAMLEGKERDAEIKARKVFLFLNLQKLLGERESDKITQIKPPKIHSAKCSSLNFKSNYINKWPHYHIVFFYLLDKETTHRY